MKDNYSLHSVVHFLKTDPEANALLHHLERILQVQKLVQETLPLSYREHVAVANIRNNQIFLSVSSSAAAARIKYYQPLIIQALKKEKYPIGSAVILIQSQS